MSWRVLFGESVGVPRFDGTDALTLATDSPTDAPIVGAITAGALEAGPGEAHLRLFFGGDAPVTVHLVGARVQADVTATSCTGRIGGAIPASEVDAAVLPGLAASYNATIASDAGCAMTPSMCGDAALALIQLFDRGIACSGPADCPASASTCDGSSGTCTCGAATCGGQLADDQVITVEELQRNDLISALLAPDVDLFDATGAYAPRVDGVADALSLGVGFTCVGATFTAPGE